jgi:hypothetical protein
MGISDRTCHFVGASSNRFLPYPPFGGRNRYEDAFPLLYTLGGHILALDNKDFL